MCILAARHRSRNLIMMSSERRHPWEPPWTRQSSRWYHGGSRPSPRLVCSGGGWRPSDWGGRRGAPPGGAPLRVRAPGRAEGTRAPLPSRRCCSPPGNCRGWRSERLPRPEMMFHHLISFKENIKKKQLDNLFS